MSVRCPSCNYLITDQWANGCPLCGAPYPAGGGRGGGGEDDGSGGSRRPLYLGLAVVFALAAGGGLMSRARNRPDPANRPPIREADSSGRVRAGMPMAEVAKVIDADAGRRRAAPDAVLARFPDIETKTGVLTWVRDGRALRIAFDRGRVVRLLELTGAGDEPEQLAVVYDDRDRPGDEE